MMDRVQTTAMADLPATDLSRSSDEAPYRDLHRLHRRADIETRLAAAKPTVFNLDGGVSPYDPTSTCLEGNARTERAYLREMQPECKQVVVGLVVDRDGSAKAHDVFGGGRRGRATVAEMLTILEGRVGRHEGATVVVGPGMAFEESLRGIR